MNSEKLVKLIPFLVLDGAIILVIVLLLQLDWIVNNTLYDYGLQFDLNWAMSYWSILRISLGLLAFALLSITVVGYVSYRKAREESLKAVFICKSCGSALTKLSGSVHAEKTLPKFKVLRSCPLCDEKLLEE